MEGNCPVPGVEAGAGYWLLQEKVVTENTIKCSNKMCLNNNNFTTPPFSWGHSAIVCGLYVGGHQSEWFSFCCDLLIRKESAPSEPAAELNAMQFCSIVLCSSVFLPQCHFLISVGLVEILCLSSCTTALYTVKSSPTHPFGFLVTLIHWNELKPWNVKILTGHARVEGAKRCIFNRFRS